jgi:aspartate/methionine/tyrosine aminotransferase
MFHPFELERWQSEWEHRVEINLADSGVLPLRLGDVVEDRDAFDDVLLHYPEVNGTRALRERIAALHPGADADNVLVTVGGSEANQLVADTLLSSGDRVVVMRPGYLQLYGLALNLGCQVEPLELRADTDWGLDGEAGAASVSDATQLVSITNPNNPTGAILTPDEVRMVVGWCESTGAWLHVDEVYRGSELDGCETQSMFGATPRTISVGSLSKSYALSGLRIGWIVAPHALVSELWRRHEYATISAASLSMHLAEVALSEPVRARLLERQRSLARTGLTIMEDWVRANADVVSLVRPRATPLAFVRYAVPVPSVQVADDIRRRANVLVVPGTYLGAEGHLRIAHALNPARTAEALERITHVLRGYLR